MIPLSHFTVAALPAHSSAAENIRFVIGIGACAAVGIVLLVLGLVERSKARRARPSVPPFPPSPPQRPTAGRGLLIGSAILIALSLAGVLLRGATALKDHVSPENAAFPVQVGQCITGGALTSGSLGPKDIIECTEPAGVFEVVSTGGLDAPCPDGMKHGSDFTRLTNAASTVCFAPNLLVDHCYATVKGLPGDPIRIDTIKPVPCTDTSAEFKVVQRFEKADYDLCAAGLHQRIWTAPPRTYCIKPSS